MSRGHSSAYRPPVDYYEAFRCVNCPHLLYMDHRTGDPCRYLGEGCDCTDHRRTQGDAA